MRPTRLFIHWYVSPVTKGLNFSRYGSIFLWTPSHTVKDCPVLRPYVVLCDGSQPSIGFDMVDDLQKDFEKGFNKAMRMGKRL